MRYARIQGTGGYLPDQVVTNAELECRVDTTAQWIIERTGIEERHVAAPDQTTCDLAELASRKAIEAAGIAPATIDLIIVATTTPDHIFPSVATQLQDRLGNYGCPAFDVQAVCTGFVYALGIADQFIRAGSTQCALVVGAETFTRIIDWQDRGTCVLFGDGAGAVVVTATDEPGILAADLHADGRYKELLWVPAGVSQGYEETQRNAAYVAMRGNEVFKVAVNTLARSILQTLETNHLTMDDIDWLVPHQANERILAATAKKVGVPVVRVISTVKTHANTSAASVPLALDVAVRDGRIQRDQCVLLVGFGGGFTWGTVLLTY